MEEANAAMKEPPKVVLRCKLCMVGDATVRPQPPVDRCDSLSVSLSIPLSGVYHFDCLTV